MEIKASFHYELIMQIVTSLLCLLKAVKMGDFFWDAEVSVDEFLRLKL